MNLHHRSSIMGEYASTRNRPAARLQGRWLVTARIAWVLLTGLPLGGSPSVSLPLRSRIQRVIDRRFYRRMYDALTHWKRQRQPAS